MARPLKFPTAAAPQTTSDPKAVQFGSKAVQSQPATPRPVKLPASQPAPARPPVQAVVYQPALDLFASRYVTLYAQDRLRVERQLQQLTPLTMSVTLDWGLKSLDRMRHVATQATALVSAFTSSRCNETLVSCIESLTGAQGGIWAKLTRRLTDTRSMESQLKALRSQLTIWLQHVTMCKEELGSKLMAHQTSIVVASKLQPGVHLGVEGSGLQCAELVSGKLLVLRHEISPR